jgi:AbiV family abortive infection protein
MTSRSEKCVIPLDKVDEGLSLVATNVQYLCQDNYTLMQAGSPWHAVVMAIFALEELTKYFVLKRERNLARSSKANSIEVDERLFGRGHGNSHAFKLNIAKEEKLVPLDAWQIHTAAFDKAYFDSGYFDVEDVTVSGALRTRNIFVDWVNGKWEIGSDFEPMRLKNFVDLIMEKLKQLVAEAG